MLQERDPFVLLIVQAVVEKAEKLAGDDSEDLAVRVANNVRRAFRFTKG